MSQLWDFPPPGDDPSQTWEEVKSAFQQDSDSKPTPNDDGSGSGDPQGKEPAGSSEPKKADDKPAGGETLPPDPPRSWGLWTKPKAKDSEEPEDKSLDKRNWGLWTKPKPKDGEEPEQPEDKSLGKLILCLWTIPKAKDGEEPEDKSLGKKTSSPADPPFSWGLGNNTKVEDSYKPENKPLGKMTPSPSNPIFSWGLWDRPTPGSERFKALSRTTYGINVYDIATDHVPPALSRIAQEEETQYRNGEDLSAWEEVSHPSISSSRSFFSRGSSRTLGTSETSSDDCQTPLEELEEGWVKAGM